MVQEQSKLNKKIKKSERNYIIFICGRSNTVLKDFPRKLKKVTGDKIYIHKSVEQIYLEISQETSLVHSK